MFIRDQCEFYHDEEVNPAFKQAWAENATDFFIKYKPNDWTDGAASTYLAF